MSYKKVMMFFLLFLSFNIKASCLTKAPIDVTKVDLENLIYYLENNIITSEQLINIYLERIEYYKDYNAIISINENAINEAKELDKKRENGEILGKLHGVPILVKDNIDVKGMPTTAGTLALSDNYPKENATVIQKLLDEGAIILAKTNMSELAFKASSSKSSYGTVKNAYNPDYSAYGSSGGSAVGVALSLAPIAIGTDTNSSIRVPAAANYLVGYRPTTGLISKTGVLPYDPERDTVGVLTKTIKDSVILTNIIKGYDSKDKKSFVSDKDIILNKNQFNYTIGVPIDFLNGSNENILPENQETYNEIKDEMTNIINKMEMQGAKIIYLNNYYTTKEDNLVASSYSGALFCRAFNEYIKNTTSNIKSFIELANSNKKMTDLSGYTKWCTNEVDMATKNENKKQYSNYLVKIFKENNLDAIMYPTTKNKLLKQGTSGIINLSAHAASTANFPAITMPLFFDSNNLPYGIEFMALEKEDEKLYNIVNSYENLMSKSKVNIANSLYDIADEVTTLLNNYEESLKSNNIFLKKWQKIVISFFKNYNEEENIEETSISLNKSFNNIINISKYIPFILIITLYLINKILKELKKRKKLYKV